MRVTCECNEEDINDDDDDDDECTANRQALSHSGWPTFPNLTSRLYGGTSLISERLPP